MMGSRGYDMTPTMYSPDGRIYQVEYAIETVKRGAIAIGLQVKDGIILAVEEKSRDLQVEDITQKIFPLIANVPLNGFFLSFSLASFFGNETGIPMFFVIH